MSAVKRPLPDFEDPPVIETVLGVQFAPLSAFSIPHLGLYWNRIRHDYPKSQVMPPLGAVFEEFGRHSTGPSIGRELVSEPDVRCWFIDESTTQLIQVQKDRFIRNWRKVQHGDVYPRYEALKPRFKADWERFLRFLEEEGIGSPEVNQCEVTYINHMDMGKGWDSYGEIDKVVRLKLLSTPREFLPEPEKVNLHVRYLMPDKRGRLHVTFQPAIRRQDAKEIFQLEITARGRPAASSIDDILDWFDTAHEWIVRGFADLTTPEMHQVWRRKV